MSSSLYDAFLNANEQRHTTQTERLHLSKVDNNVFRVFSFESPQQSILY